ncbi:hypothetical protein GCM10010833_18790 [Blastomonas aquatica]|uniref:Uncharacterized protein n=1 Tax=Blastomonas aquatica TaxID=1510276 RepID=A0ABQ1JCM6_9SPHN|nr:hypothetical protein GCM10010833_18790 [Blastomonas aquatica]
MAGSEVGAQLDDDIAAVLKVKGKRLSGHMQSFDGTRIGAADIATRRRMSPLPTPTVSGLLLQVRTATHWRLRPGRTLTQPERSGM